MNRQEIINQIFDNRGTMKRGMHRFWQDMAVQLPVSRTQLELMFTLHQAQPVHSKQLAGQLGLTPGAVSQLLDTLFTADFVTRTTDKDDRRLQSLHLTKKGEKLVASLEKKRGEIMERVVSELPTEELAVWLHVQQKMIEHFEAEYKNHKETK